jgi:hypothetical protein
VAFSIQFRDEKMNGLVTYDLYCVLAAEAFGVPLERIEVGDARWSWARMNAPRIIGRALPPPGPRNALRRDHH